MALRAGGAEALRRTWLPRRGSPAAGLASFDRRRHRAALTVAVGEAWLDGRIAVYEEHLYSEAVQSVLRSALVPFQAGLEAHAPRVLLTTVPGEAHGLGLLMAEALMTLESCRCLSLGTQTPIADIVAAAAAHRIDVVALSFAQSLAGRRHRCCRPWPSCAPACPRRWRGSGRAADSTASCAACGLPESA